jgi:hypothetical protein
VTDEQRNAIETGISAMKACGWTSYVPVLQAILSATQPAAVDREAVANIEVAQMIKDLSAAVETGMGVTISSEAQAIAILKLLLPLYPFGEPQSAHTAARMASKSSMRCPRGGGSCSVESCLEEGACTLNRACAAPPVEQDCTARHDYYEPHIAKTPLPKSHRVEQDERGACNAQIRKWRESFDVMHRRAMNAEANVDDLSMLVRQLVHSLRKAAPDNVLSDRAVDYLKRNGFAGSPLRDATRAASTSANVAQGAEAQSEPVYQRRKSGLLAWHDCSYEEYSEVKARIGWNARELFVVPHSAGMVWGETIPDDCDVRKILLSVEPGDGDGHEVYARNVAEIEELLSSMGERLEDLQGAVTALPDELHPDTANLVRRFSQALANKLLSAQRKYGYSTNWQRDDWAGECRAELMRHIAKGDPRDVAAYCAFLWHHNESTAAPPAQTALTVTPAMVKAAMPWLTGLQHMRKTDKESNVEEAIKAALTAAQSASGEAK